MAPHPDAGTFYVANLFDNTVMAIDTATDKVPPPGFRDDSAMGFAAARIPAFFQASKQGDGLPLQFGP